MQAELSGVKREAHEALQDLEKQLQSYKAESAEAQAFLQDKAALLRQAAGVEQRLEAERISAARQLRYVVHCRLHLMPFPSCESFM